MRGKCEAENIVVDSVDTSSELPPIEGKTYSGMQTERDVTIFMLYTKLFFRLLILLELCLESFYFKILISDSGISGGNGSFVISNGGIFF